MNDKLYFIPIIERALKQADAGLALGKAFKEIRRKGAHKPYSEGYRNFEQFMDIAYSRCDVISRDRIRRFITASATETLDSPRLENALRLDVINLHPEWEDEYESSCDGHTPEDLPQSRNPVIRVSSYNRTVGELHFDKVPGRKLIGGIVPGIYVLKLVNTGWTIWHGELTDRELILTEAFGEADLRLAAGEEGGRPTKEVDLLNNEEVVLRTYPGIESGSIEIELVR